MDKEAQRQRLQQSCISLSVSIAQKEMELTALKESLHILIDDLAGIRHMLEACDNTKAIQIQIQAILEALNRWHLMTRSPTSSTAH